MDTKKTILVSVLTTIATMFVAVVIMHMCCGRCGGKSSCKKQASHCEKSDDHQQKKCCKSKVDKEVVIEEVVEGEVK